MEKISILVVGGLLLASVAAHADQAPYAITESGPHHRVWQQVFTKTNQVGELVQATNRYTELATGLNHLVAGQWVASSEAIEITADGAAATNGQHQVYFAPNLNTLGSVHLVMPDGRDMRSHLTGLSYYDASIGSNVLIAQLQDTAGQVLPTLNQVLYTNAFEGVNADVRYTYTKAGLEQDVILREQPPSPATYGLNPQTTILQVWTEFSEAPEPSTVSQTNQSLATLDPELIFGPMRMIHGKAFSIAETNELAGAHASSHIRPRHGASVSKAWAHTQGRTFLLEQVPLGAITSQVQTLPPRRTASIHFPGNSGSPGVSPHRDEKLMATDATGKAVCPSPLLPSTMAQVSRPAASPASKSQALATPINGEFSKRPAFQMASLEDKNPGFVLDYVEVNSVTSDCTFASGETYFISGEFDATGTTSFEGGTVLKYSFAGQIDLVGSSDTLVCTTTSPYNPAVLTSMNDGAVGAIITGCNYTPALGDVNCFLSGNGEDLSLHDMRFSYCNEVLNYGGDETISLQNCQFLNNAIIVEGGSANISLSNVLVTGQDDSFSFGAIQGGSLLANNVTVDGVLWFSDCGSVGETNCMFSYTWVDGDSVTWYNVATQEGGDSTDYPASPYESGSLGDFYLVSGSPYIDAGVGNANDLGFYWYTTQASGAIEGYSAVDMGYHYPGSSSGSTLVSGTPDYIADANGNGIPDSWETATGVVLTGPNNIQTVITTGYSLFLAEPKLSALFP